MKRRIINEYGEQVVTINSSDRGPLTRDEQEMIRRMDDIIDEYDDDCPPMPEEMIIQMQNDIEAHRRMRIVRDTQTPVRAGGAVNVMG